MPADSVAPLAPASPGLWLDTYDRGRIGDNALLNMLGAAIGAAAASATQDWGHLGPFIAVLTWYVGDLLNRVRISGWALDAGQRNALMRNALFAFVSLVVNYAPWLFSKIELPIAYASLVPFVLDVLNRWLTNHKPDLVDPKARPSMPSILGLILIAALLIPGVSFAGPRKIRVGANVQGQWTWVNLISPSRDILDWTVEFGDDAGPQPTPVPVPVPPAPGPEPLPPVPTPPGPGPIPAPPVDPTFPAGEYQIATDVYRVVRAVTTANRRNETTALADAVAVMKAECETGSLKDSGGIPIALAFTARFKAALGDSYPAWKAQVATALQAAINKHWNAGKLENAAQWAVLLGEIVPALREAARR